MLTRIITPPAQEPITLAEAKAHLRLENTLDDVTVAMLIQTARQYVEEVTWRGIVSQTWELVMDSFPTEEYFELPKGKLASVTSITYLDTAGAAQVLAGSEYEVDSTSEPGKVRLAYEKTWPITRSRWNAVVTRYVVGWDVDVVPRPIKHAILLLVSQMYEHRTPEITGTIVSAVRFAVDALLGPYRLRRF